MRYKDKIVLQTYISQELYTELKRRAESIQLPLSSYVRLLLVGALNKDVTENINTGTVSNSSNKE